MQFDTKVLYHHKKIVVESILDGFKKLGGVNTESFIWEFPTEITEEHPQEIIHNTCFVCGGLMQDGQAIKNHPLRVQSEWGEVHYSDPNNHKMIQVRKCTSCGHSHT